MNYFHNLRGRRVAEALSELGFAVDVTTLDDCPPREYELGVLSNIPAGGQIHFDIVSLAHVSQISEAVCDRPGEPDVAR
jgi:hypothetical protein